MNSSALLKLKSKLDELSRQVAEMLLSEAEEISARDQLRLLRDENQALQLQLEHFCKHSPLREEMARLNRTFENYLHRGLDETDVWNS